MKRYWFANNDLSIIILNRLPVKLLHSLKYVSKEWLTLISDRTFVTSQLKKNEPISGFFFQEVFEWTCDEGIESISYIPVDVQNITIWRSVLDFLPENVVILSLNNGLLCCRSCFPTPDPKIYICNPLNKQWTSPHWPNHNISQHSSISLSFDPFQNPIDISTHYKLLAVSEIKIEKEDEDEDGDGDGDGDGDEENEYCFCFDIYSSEAGSWRRSKELCISKHILVKSKNVTVDGVSYWLTFGNQILMFDIKNELSWLITTPLPQTEFSSIPEMCLGEWQGRLYYVIVSEDGLQLWVLEDHFASTWELKTNILLELFEKENSDVVYKLSEKIKSRSCKETPAWMDPLSFKDGVLLVRVSVNVYLYEFETRRLRKLCHVTNLGPKSMFSPIVVPYSMSLVPIDD